MSIAGELKRKRSEEYRNMKQSGGLGGGVRSVQGKTGHVEINGTEIPLSDTINITVHDSIMALRRDLESKAEQSEIERLELMIKDIVEGEDGEYVIPRTTDNPISQEIFYQSKSKEEPKANWIGDDWGSWNVSNPYRLELDSPKYYSGANARVSGEGKIILTFAKDIERNPHILTLKRDGKTIIDTGHIRENKVHTLYVKEGDSINILASFVGHVDIEYIGLESDLRLSVYKNGQVEEVANKRLVEERLEDYATKDEVLGKTGKLDDLATKDKETLVDAINEVNSKAAANKTIISSGEFYPELAFDGSSKGMQYNIRKGYYYRIGDLVHFSIDIKLSNKGASKGEATIEGMPFRNGKMVRSYVIPVVEYLQVTSDQEWVQPSLEFPADSDYMEFKVNNHNSRRWPRTDANFSNNTRIQLEGTYII